MIEKLLVPCENPCPGCPAQNRLGRKATTAAARAEGNADMIEAKTKQRRIAQEVILHASSLLENEGVMGQEWLNGFESRRGPTPTHEEVSRLAEEIGVEDTQLELRLEELGVLNDKSAENAAVCNGVKRYELGPITINRCTSANVPLVQQFSVSDI